MRENCIKDDNFELSEKINVREVSKELKARGKLEDEITNNVRYTRVPSK